jgi:hypothetical protein
MSRAADRPGRLRVALLALILCAIETVLPRSQERAMRVDGLVQWLAAVERHEPGKIDESALPVSSWYRRDLASLFPYIRGFFELLSQGGGASRRMIPSGEWDRLRKLAASHAAHADPLRFAKRAAMLHADVAIFGIDRTPEIVARRQGGVVRRPPDPGIPERSYASGVDGRYEGDGEGQGHWDAGRVVLDLVRPSESDVDILLWYRAAAAVMMAQANLAEALPHLKQGLSLFPSDQHMWFAWGCLHESFASSRIQRIRDRVHATGGRVAVEDEEENLERAARAYRRVLEVDKVHTEARIRLGRVLGARGNARGAAVLLRPPLDERSGEILSYYRWLFLGAEEEKLGNRAAAERAFREASRLFPAAQSPRLALALLAVRGGDRRVLDATLEPLRRSPSSRGPADEPWWIYGLCEGRDQEMLVARLRHTIAGLSR